MAAKKLTESTIIEVYNNTTGTVSFRSESTRKKYKWDKADAIRKVPLGELRELYYSRGGEVLLQECLLIKDIAVREELGLPVEKEHILDKKEISELLKTGSVDELENVLEKTNGGIKEKIVATAIDEQITDTEKMEVIQSKTGIDVYAQIKEKKEDAKEKAKKKETK